METAPVTTQPRSWWSRPCGGRGVLTLALPLVVSSLSWTLLTFIDRIFLAWWSIDALAASFPAALLWWSSICFPLGTCMYASVFVSQYVGSGERERIGPVVWQSVWIGVIATPIVTLVLPLAPHIFAVAGHGSRVMAQEIAYYRILCVGTAAMLISYAMSSFYSGQGKTWIVMLVDAGSAVLNIVLDYLWIFGHAGFPAMGIEGAAWATSVALWMKVLVYLVLLFRKHNRLAFRSHHVAFRRKLMHRLLYFGGPSGLQMFLEVVGFTVFVFLVGGLGEIELAATNMAFNVSSVAFMPVFGLATAASILVGQQLGRDRPDLAARATWTTMWLAVGYMGFISALYVLVPDLFLYGFFARNQIENSTQIRSLAVLLLRFVAAYNMFDALNLVFAHAVKGAGDTHFVFLISLVMAIALAVGTWVAMHVLGFGLRGCWTLITVWVTALGCLYLARFCQGKWRSMRVIEVANAPAS